MKDLIGKTVWLRGTGNNAGRGRSTYVHQAVLTSVGRLNVLISVEGRDPVKLRYMLDNRCPGDITLHDNCNGGYVLFKSELEATNSILKDKLINSISNACRYGRDLEMVSLEGLQSIAKILDLIK